MLLDMLAGLLLAVVVSLAAWRAKALSPQGALAAGMLGTVIFGFGGLGWAVVLLGFFVSSSLLSRLFRRRKAALEDTFSKGARRDAGQVAANGAVAGLFVLLHALLPGAGWPWIGFAGALAAANADTWATELGVLSRSVPRSIATGRQVARGASGGITRMGTLAAAAGSLLIALLAVLFWQGHVMNPAGGAPEWLARALGAQLPRLAPLPAAAWLAVITLAGLAGSLVDSFLGATVQAIYTCPSCHKETERHPFHTCGTPTTLLRGWKWLDNDWVNTSCTISGSLVALIAAILKMGIS